MISSGGVNLMRPRISLSQVAGSLVRSPCQAMVRKVVRISGGNRGPGIFSCWGFWASLTPGTIIARLFCLGEQIYYLLIDNEKHYNIFMRVNLDVSLSNINAPFEDKEV